MTTPLGKWMIAERRPRETGRKTDVWDVWDHRGGKLGEIRFSGRWRQYVFAPTSGSLFSAGCLDDLRRFSEDQTRDWRITR
jgi:hypothetical protein